MTIDEVMKKIKEKMACDYNISGCDTCDISSCEDRDIIIQLAEWLEELKEYKFTLLTPQMVEDLKKSEKQAHKIAIQNAMLVENLYKTIDDFPQSLKENLNPYYGNYGLDFSYEKMCEFIDMYVKQLKAGGMNEYNI